VWVSNSSVSQVAMVKKPNPVKPAGVDDDDMLAPDPPGLVALKALVYFMGMLIVAGVAFLVYTLVQRASNLEPAISDVEAVVQVAAQPGDKVQSVSVDGTTLALHVRTANGQDAVILYNLRRQQVIQRLEIAPQ
jgi:hypothetical protein